jgi:hypothetical protein
MIDDTMSKTEIQNIIIQSILPPSVFAISIAVSVINLQIAYYFWMVINTCEDNRKQEILTAKKLKSPYYPVQEI